MANTPTLEGLLHHVPVLHEYLSGTTLIQLCDVSKGLRVTAIDLARKVLLNERRTCFGVPAHSNPTACEALPEDFPTARLPEFVAQTEEMLSEAALQISYKQDMLGAGLVRAMAHNTIRPLIRGAAEGFPKGAMVRDAAPSHLPPVCSLALGRDKCSMGQMPLPLDLDNLWWEEVEEAVNQELRTRSDSNSGRPFTRQDVLRVLALRATTFEHTHGLCLMGRFSIGIFLLRDGRFALIGTASDVQWGWRTHVGRHVEVSTSLELLVRVGMADWERRYLGVLLPARRASGSPGDTGDHAHVDAAQGGGGAKTSSQRRRNRRRQIRALTLSSGMRRKWHTIWDAPLLPWDTEGWRWTLPFPPMWKARDTERMQAAKRPSTACLSLHLASSRARAANQQRFEPLPGVSVTVTEWRRDLQADPRNGVLHVWQLDNKSSASVRFCVQSNQVDGEHCFGGELQTRVEAGRCIDVLSVNGSWAHIADAWREVVWEVVSE